MGRNLVDPGTVAACCRLERFVRRQELFCRPQGTQEFTGELHKSVQFVVNCATEELAMALLGGCSARLLLHTEDHCLSTSLQRTEGVAAGICHNGFRGLHGLGQLW
ncbi:hypothetical protein [Streptomyces prasinus]